MNSGIAQTAEAGLALETAVGHSAIS